VKEPRSLLFFRGAIYICTFNDPTGRFSQSQMAILFDLPTQEQVDNWQPVKVLLAPPGTKEVMFDEERSKQSYLEEGYTECSISVTKQYTQALSNNLQGKRKQYGLKHNVSSTIHGAMGDTLRYMATQISTNNTNFSLWDKGQLVVILSRTKLAKNSMFIGPKNDTLDALQSLLTKKNQWSDYIEEILSLVTINHQETATATIGNNNNNSMSMNSFPYRICDIPLPEVASGYVYMLVSLRHRNYTYIGTTKCIRTRIQMHNTGNGAVGTAPAYLRPFALFAYICGFPNNRTDLRYSIENRWKERRDYLISQGQNEIKSWAFAGKDVITNIEDNAQQFGVNQSDLKLVCLFDNV
jgi:predicted GIY-YIG superfamily endonuclease